MPRRILILLGHPDPAPERFCRQLAQRYADAAAQSGHAVRVCDLALKPFASLVSQSAWMAPSEDAQIAALQDDIAWCEHLVVIYPLWLGDMPAALKACFEQVLRPGFAFSRDEHGRVGKPRLGGRSARVIVTMGMPGFFYRLVYRAHSLKSLQRNILRFVGFRPVRSTVIGMVEGSAAGRERALQHVADLARRAR